MPIMMTSEHPEKFSKLLLGAMIALTTFYIVFAELCYAAYSDGMN